MGSFTILKLDQISTDDIFKYVFLFSQYLGFVISCKLSKETICMKCHSLFSGKNKKSIVNLFTYVLAQRVAKFNKCTPYLHGVLTL